LDLVDDRAHAFLQGIVLRIDAIDAGERLGLLDPISLWPEVGALTSPPRKATNCDDYHIGQSALSLRSFITIPAEPGAAMKAIKGSYWE